MQNPVDENVNNCYLCTDAIAADQECYGHTVNGHQYCRLNVNQLPGYPDPDQVIHAVHLTCLKTFIEKGQPNQCGVCRAELSAQESSPLGEVYRSPEIQENALLRQRWITNFPYIQGNERPQIQENERRTIFQRNQMNSAFHREEMGQVNGELVLFASWACFGVCCFIALLHTKP